MRHIGALAVLDKAEDHQPLEPRDVIAVRARAKVHRPREFQILEAR